MLSCKALSRAIGFLELVAITVRPFSTQGSPPNSQTCKESLQLLKMEHLERIIDYHHDSKHHLEQYARGPGYLDWANQPKPFREFEGAPIYNLDLTDLNQSSPTFDQVFNESAQPADVDFAGISQLFRDSLGLSSWKSYGPNKWSLRCNPSSGNLHPTEGYLIISAIQGLASDSGGVYHYRPKEHALELRTKVPSELIKDALSNSGGKHGFFIGLSSIHWREAWKYGERAFRYCQHDVGHAIEAITVAAGGLGWSTHVLDDVLTFHDLQALLGLKHQLAHASHEEPDVLLYIQPKQPTDTDTTFSAESLKRLVSFLGNKEENEWLGKANQLGPREVHWKRLEEANEISRKFISTSSQELKSWSKFASLHSDLDPVPPLRKIIHQRRSAQDFDPDPEKTMTSESFYNILRSVQKPFASLPWEPNVHLALFLHAVEGMDNGLYILVRNPAHLEELKANIDNEYEWTRPANCPPDIQLYQIGYGGNTRNVAKTVSCHQDIAADSSFSLGMIARFEDSLRDKGAWFYRRLYWECGMIGQRLYLEAEAIKGGFRGTGIGCFFDDVMHSILGFRNVKYQSLYHFTVGFPVTDTRIMTLDPYYHLPRDRTHGLQ